MFSLNSANSVRKIFIITATLEFFINVSLNLLNSVTKIFVITVKGLELAPQPPLL